MFSNFSACTRNQKVLNVSVFGCLDYFTVKDDEKKKVSVINEQLNDKKQFVVYSPFVLLYSYVIHRQPLHKHRFTSNILSVRWVQACN